jgi:hypothetical protein
MFKAKLIGSLQQISYFKLLFSRFPHLSTSGASWTIMTPV